jgi:hypothetical protein
MKVVFTVFILTMFICGCVSSDCFVSATANPQMGEKYRLYFNTLKVVQVCEGSVHVKHHSYGGLRVCVIPLVNDYVTDSYLRPGLYEYKGPYTYEVIKDLPGNKRTHTVRLFQEVKE